MNWKSGFSKLVFGGAILVAIGIAAFGFLTFQRNLDAMRAASQENITWSATQLERELTRFRDSLGAVRAGTSSSTAEINQRFDVLWSRVAIFQRGKVGERLREYDRETKVIPRLLAELKRQEVRVVSISSFDFTSLSAIQQAFYPFAAELHDLSLRVTTGEEEKAALVREQFRKGANFALYASIATLILAIGALVYFVREGRKYRKLAAKNLVLADRFKAASEVKSRFLTMMSHELRTPMNGVLGLLALARQNDSADERNLRLDQASQSANRMLDMLTDILDFAALEADSFVAEMKPFLTDNLLRALPETLGPAAQQADVRLQVRIEGDIPPSLRGDMTRLRRSYALMVHYFLETAGAQDIEVVFSYNNGRLRAEIRVDYLDGGWSPDLIFGDSAADEDRFASEVLGPTVARLLVDKMGGEIRLEDSKDSKIILVVEVPVEAVRPKGIKIKLHLQSAPMEMILKSAIADIPVQYLDENAKENPCVVMVETGAGKAKDTLSQIRKTHPSALVFGLGREASESDYDFVAEMPQDAARLKARLREMIETIE